MPLLSNAELADQAGVDPWALHAQLAQGDPAEIDALASAFLTAAGHTADAHASARRARAYVVAGYSVDDRTPLDYTGDVALADKGIREVRTRREHLALIGRQLDLVGRELARSTAASHAELGALERSLHDLDIEWQGFCSVAHPDQPKIFTSRFDAVAARAVDAVRLHGGRVRTTVSTYEQALHHSLRALAELGYLPPDALDEGPGDIDLTSVAGGQAGHASVAAARRGDAGAFDSSTVALSLINTAIAHDGDGHVTDSQYAYLSAYYGVTVVHCAAIAAVARRRGAGARWADGLANLTRGAQQRTDGGAGPTVISPTGAVMGRGGYDGLPAAVREVLASRLGTVQDTDHTPMRRADYVDGHWVIRNLANDRAFVELLAMGGVVHASPQFLTHLAHAALSWKHDLNQVDHQTYQWVKADHDSSCHLGAPDIDPSSLHLPDGFTAHVDTLGHPVNDDTFISNALGLAAGNHNVATNLLLDATDRRALLGLNWTHGEGAAELILTGTAPGSVPSDRAAMLVMHDTGCDYVQFDRMATPQVRHALAVMAAARIATFAQPGPTDTTAVTTLCAPDGSDQLGVALSDTDRTRFLKMIALSGPADYGLVHAAAIDAGADYLVSAQHHPAVAAALTDHATALTARVGSAGLAAAHDLARSQSEHAATVYEHQVAAAQRAATEAWHEQLVTGAVGAILGAGGLATNPAVSGALGAASYAFGLVQSAGDLSHGPQDVVHDMNTTAIKSLQRSVATVQDDSRQEHATTAAVAEDNRSIAILAAGREGHDVTGMVDPATGLPYSAAGQTAAVPGQTRAEQGERLDDILTRAYGHQAPDSGGSDAADVTLGAASGIGAHWSGGGNWSAATDAHAIIYGNQTTYDLLPMDDVTVGQYSADNRYYVDVVSDAGSR